MFFDPVIPLPWILFITCLVLVPTVYFYRRSGRRLGASRNGFLLALRIAALCGIISLLLQPTREEKVILPTREKFVVFAVDRSISMLSSHPGGSSRIDSLRVDLDAAGVVDGDLKRHRFFTFDETAYTSNHHGLAVLAADGKNTKFDTSIARILRLSGSPPPAGLFILSDGHDFELVPPGETARRARSRDIPIFGVPYGTGESARDVSIRIASYHPHTFIRQSTQLEVFIRATGCPHETLSIELLRGDETVQRKTLDTGTDSFHNLGFTVNHEEPGQFEYSFRIAPVANEKELSNNTATTYLNVIADRIRILEIEGKPFWDTTFLRRSFARNDKFDIDSLVAFTGDRTRPIRSNPEHRPEDLKPPASAADLRPYNVVVLGREVERVIGENGIRAIDEWVKNDGGIVIFSRGQAWNPDVTIGTEMEPINWNTSSARGVRLEVTPQAGSISAFRLLREVAAADEFPEVISFPATSQPKTLATAFSVAADQSPAVVYRRYGNGQTLSLGVGNLWRWVFNPRAEYDNNAYDRFWDQLALWLLSNSGIAPVDGFSLRADTANLPLGETIHLRLMAHGRELPAVAPTAEFFQEGKPATSIVMTRTENNGPYLATFTPRDIGRYTVTTTVPGNAPLSARFMVFRNDLEAIETSVDRLYLEQLSKASGGRLIEPSEIASVAAELLRGSEDQPPLSRRIPIWDRPLIYAILCFLLAADWYARRRWGLT